MRTKSIVVKHEQDWDYICEQLSRRYGWGYGSPGNYIEDFEESGYFTNKKNPEKTIQEFNSFLWNLNFNPQ